MAKGLFLFLGMTGLMGLYFSTAQAAEIRMGDKVFQGKVTVHQDGTVTTDSTAKEADIEGEGKKRLKLKHKDGKLIVVDEKGEEVVLEEGGTKLKRRSRLGASGQTGPATSMTSGEASATAPNIPSAKRTMAATEAAAKVSSGKAKTIPGEAPVTQKAVRPKFDIKKITLEAEEKGVVTPGRPLMVLVEVNAFEEIPGPFVVNLELKKGKEKQKFIEGIEKLQQGTNSFKWDLIGKSEEAQYTLSVEIAHDALKINDKAAKVFRVGEKRSGKKE